jgi:transcriptional regulator GlxA family with amidase domain
MVRGLKDPAIGKAIIAVHRRLAELWTIETMAREAGMSRSAFSSRFVELVGDPPISYVSRWRLNRAAFLLRSGNSKLADLAPRVGYQSEASLSRAFKRCFGLSPGAYRRHCAARDGNEGMTPGSADKVPLYPSDCRDGASTDSGLFLARKSPHQQRRSKT